VLCLRGLGDRTGAYSYPSMSRTWRGEALLVRRRPQGAWSPGEMQVPNRHGQPRRTPACPAEAHAFGLQRGCSRAFGKSREGLVSHDSPCKYVPRQIGRRGDTVGGSAPAGRLDCRDRGADWSSTVSLGMLPRAPRPNVMANDPNETSHRGSQSGRGEPAEGRLRTDRRGSCEAAGTALGAAQARIASYTARQSLMSAKR
jgi:hypothetical protein